MVRLGDLDPAFAQHLRELPLPVFEGTPSASGPPLRESRVALVSTAGLHRRADAVFSAGASDYRLIPGDLDPTDLVMSHVSVNFDRSGFQQDTNVVFPLALLHEMAESHEIGSVARWHYSFMGATDPSRIEGTGREVGWLLKSDGVTCALLVPV